MPQEESIQSLKEEIRELEKKLASRKDELQVEGEIKLPEEKELFREVLRKQIEKAKESIDQEPTDKTVISSGSVPQTSPHDYAAQTKGQADDIREKEHHEQVEALIEIALTKGILDAVRVVRHLENPHLLDDFHDILVDEFYEKLVQSRTISP